MRQAESEVISLFGSGNCLVSKFVDCFLVHLFYGSFHCFHRLLYQGASFFHSNHTGASTERLNRQLQSMRFVPSCLEFPSVLRVIQVLEGHVLDQGGCGFNVSVEYFSHPPLIMLNCLFGGLPRTLSRREH